MVDVVEVKGEVNKLFKSVNKTAHVNRVRSFYAANTSILLCLIKIREADATGTKLLVHKKYMNTLVESYSLSGMISNGTWAEILLELSNSDDEKRKIVLLPYSAQLFKIFALLENAQKNFLIIIDFDRYQSVSNGADELWLKVTREARRLAKSGWNLYNINSNCTKTIIKTLLEALTPGIQHAPSIVLVRTGIIQVIL